MNTLENLIRILEEKGIEYKRFEHEPVKTSEEAARIRGVPLDSGVKAMLLKTREGKFIMVLLPADKKIDFKKIEQLEGTKNLEFASPEEVQQETGCEIGGVPPFGHIKRGQPYQIKTYMNKDVLEKNLVNFNAGDRSVSVTMKAKDLTKVVQAIVF